MREISGNAWDYYNNNSDVTLCITTNGFVKANGECVMGRGIAFTAKTKFPSLPYRLGQLIAHHGNYPFYLPDLRIITYPVKHNWWEVADLDV